MHKSKSGPTAKLPPPLPAIHTYSTRNDALTPATTWRLAGDTLIRDYGTGQPQVIALTDITQLRLDFAPSRPERNRFRCRLTTAQGRTLVVYSRTYAGPLNFKETVPEYLDFVRALVSVLPTHSPQCVFIAGATWPSYLVNLAATGFIFLCFAAIAWFLFRINLTWMIAIKVLILVFYVPTLLLWAIRNRPHRFDPSAIPADVLPELDPQKKS